MRFTGKGLLLGLWMLAVFAGGRAAAQQRDAYGNPIGGPAEAADASGGAIRQTVARISELDGSVSYARGDDPENWLTADRNVPVTLGDRLYAGPQSRVELQVHGGSYVRLGSDTDLAVLNLTDDTKQFAIKSGVASIRIRRLDSDEVYEVDTPNAAITFERPGDYRVDIDPDGNTRVSVREGAASVAAGGGSVSIGTGDALEIWGADSPQYETVAILAPDGWDRWGMERETRIARAMSYQYVSNDISGLDDLDQNGRWESIPTYGNVWSPTVVAAGWAPYRDGRWMWQDPWGWTWVAAEPWGWAPYHYGRWVFWSSRWYWVPVPQRVRYVTYSPALVAFVGGGPGWSASIAVSTGGYVGWFPLAPRDPFIRWWGPRPSVHVTNVTYVNRTYVTVVNRTTFVSGGLVYSNVVRDQAVVRQVEAAPVLRGPLPLAPTRESIRVSTRPTVAVVRPPAAVVSRSVVARVAPPPAPPTFDRKVAVIRENGGAPVSSAEAAQIAVRDRSRPLAAAVVRPVSPDSGRVTLAPRDRATTTASRPVSRVEPVAPVRGRAMATSQQPVASAPVSAPRTREGTREREAPAMERPSSVSTPPPASRQRPTPRAEVTRQSESDRARQAEPVPTRSMNRQESRPREVSQGESPQRRESQERVSPRPVPTRAPAAPPERPPARETREQPENHRMATPAQRPAGGATERPVTPRERRVEPTKTPKKDKDSTDSRQPN
jgi:hypothetical protein